ncbi:hypothetical protein MBLNU459_g3745t2 [Dothideomycetes sp. NU459]
MLRQSASRRCDFRAVCVDTARLPRSTAARHVSRRSYASESGESKSFKGQLYDSTHQRIQREKAEQARFAQIRGAQKTAGGAPAWIVPLVLATGAVAGYLFGRQTPAPPLPNSTLPLSEAQPPQHNTAPTNLEAAWADFRDIVGQENVSTEAADLTSHSGSEWSSHPALPDDRPFCVVRPASTEEVSEIMKVCHRRKIPVTAYSGGTSLEGHFAATRGGICVDFSRMDKILALHKSDLDVVVQPAVGWEGLNEELNDQGLFFPPDPGPGAMIGGMIGTGCSGTNSYRYGTMKDWVLGLTVVMADGSIVKTKQRPRKSSAGYDLTRVFIGSEGTLGLVTEATLKVTVLPQNTSVAVSTFGTVREAANAVFRVVGAGVPIAAIELLDDVQMRCINDGGQTSRSWKEAPTLFFKFSGTPTSVKEHIAIVQKLAKSEGSKTFEFAKNQEEADELWSARKQALWSVIAKKQNDGDHVWTTDVAVPISRLPDIVEETKEAVSKSGLTGAIVGHVGDGNFHTILLYNDKEHDLAEDLVHRMVKRAIEMEGTATGEHGVGLVKRDYLEHELGVNAVDLMRKNREKLMELTQQRNRELEEENAYLRSRVSGDTFALNVGENEEKSSEYSASAPSVSPQAPHLSGVGITRSASTSASRNNPVASIHAPVQHPESWRQHNAFSPTGSTATPFLAEPSQTSSTTSSASWRAQDVGNPQRHGTSTERNPWPGSTPSFSYQVRPNERTASYPAPTHSMSYTANSPAAQFQTAAANPAAPTAIGANFHAPGVSPQGDFQSLSLASPTAFTSPHNQGYHEQQPTSHAAYPGASVQVQVPTGYHGNSQEVHRGLAPPAYNAPAVSSNFMQSQGSHSIPNNYRESPGQTYTYNT